MRARSLAATALAASVAIACARQPHDAVTAALTPAPVRAERRDAVASAADAADVVDAGEATSTRDAAAAIDAAATGGEATATATALVSAPEWLVAHGTSAARANAANLGDACEAIALGSPPEPALACDRIEHVQRGKPGGAAWVYRVLVHRGLHVVRGGDVVTLLDVVTTVAALDPEGPDPGNVVDLSLVVAADGRSVTLSDAAPRPSVPPPYPVVWTTCAAGAAAAEKMARDDDAFSRRWGAFDRDLVARACGARGTWTWTAGKLTRTH